MDIVSINIVAIVLLVLLVLFFLLFAFLAVFHAETKRPRAFPLSYGFFLDGSQALTLQKLREKYFEEDALQHLSAPNQEHFPQSPSGSIKTSFSPSLSSDLSKGKNMKMKTYIDAKKQDEMTAHTETIETDGEELADYGFTPAEITSLLWLQKWYQSGGSDRMGLVRHWEFLRLLVHKGELDV